MLSNDDDPIAFVGGKDYLPLFGTLTASLRTRKVVVFNSRTQPDLPQGFELVRYRTTTRTTWHYECARIWPQVRSGFPRITASRHRSRLL